MLAVFIIREFYWVKKNNKSNKDGKSGFKGKIGVVIGVGLFVGLSFWIKKQDLQMVM